MTREPSRYVPVRVKEAGHTHLRQRAVTETGGNVSELVRRMLKYATARMPKGWNG